MEVAVRVLGIDPGLTRCGVAVVDGAPGQRLVAGHIGVIRTSADTPTAQRLLELHAAIAELVVLHRPEAVAVERVFSQHNVRTAMGTAQAAAIALLVAAEAGLPVALHTPTEVKAAVTGNGRADKQQVTAMVVRLLRLDAPPKPPDAADAVAIAVCQLWRGQLQGRLSRAAAG